jgi:hypothetical protein
VIKQADKQSQKPTNSRIEKPSEEAKADNQSQQEDQQS